jgi:hypothetical protein
MSTESDQRYIVHLDIQVTAHDPHDAIQSALGKVSISERDNFACHAEEARGSATPSSVPVSQRRSAEFVPRARVVAGRQIGRLLPGEFLG